MTQSTGIVRDDVCSIRVLLWHLQVKLIGNLLFTRTFSRKEKRLMTAGTMFTHTININLASRMKINENIFLGMQNETEFYILSDSILHSSIDCSICGIVLHSLEMATER